MLKSKSTADIFQALQSEETVFGCLYESLQEAAVKQTERNRKAIGVEVIKHPLTTLFLLGSIQLFRQNNSNEVQKYNSIEDLLRLLETKLKNIFYLINSGPNISTREKVQLKEKISVFQEAFSLYILEGKSTARRVEENIHTVIGLLTQCDEVCKEVLGRPIDIYSRIGTPVPESVILDLLYSATTGKEENEHSKFRQTQESTLDTLEQGLKSANITQGKKNSLVAELLKEVQQYYEDYEAISSVNFLKSLTTKVNSCTPSTPGTFFKDPKVAHVSPWPSPPETPRKSR